MCFPNTFASHFSLFEGEGGGRHSGIGQNPVLFTYCENEKSENWAAFCFVFRGEDFNGNS